ncbi:AraC family transcriptional regulator [Clostridioides difficile]|uniref:helix-turn-helix domain-containing protein n=1 Tax=Clostridioides difficile TaxID=1496 RepID=UPI002FD1348B
MGKVRIGCKKEKYFYVRNPVKSLVSRITENEQFAIYHFTHKSNWRNEVFSILQRLIRLEKSKNEMYMYEALVSISFLWLIIIKNIVLSPIKHKNRINIHMQKILRYIEKYYCENLILEYLSNSANISKSECSRCFKLSLNITPYKYFTEFRLLKATQFLKGTNEIISDTAIKVVFHQIIYFSKCFKEKMGYSPKAYRNIKKER